MGFSRILAEFAEKNWLAENPPEKNTASRKSAENVGQPAEYNKKYSAGGSNFKYFPENQLTKFSVIVSTAIWR